MLGTMIHYDGTTLRFKRAVYTLTPLERQMLAELVDDPEHLEEVALDLLIEHRIVLRSEYSGELVTQDEHEEEREEALAWEEEIESLRSYYQFATLGRR